MFENGEKNRGKKSKLIIGCAIGLLVILIAVFAFFNARGNQYPGDRLTIKNNEITMLELTYEELKKLPAIRVEKTITSSKEEDETGDYTGIPIEVILSEFDQAWGENYKKFNLIAADGYISAVSKQEILIGENVLVVYEKDGEALKAYSQGGAGPLRIIILSDEFGTRSVKNLVGIEVQ